MKTVDVDKEREVRSQALLRRGLELLHADPGAGQGPDFIGVINEVPANVAKEVRTELGPQALELIEALEGGAVGLQVAWLRLETLGLLVPLAELPALLQVRPPPGAFRVGVFLADGAVRALVLQAPDLKVPSDGGKL